MTALIFALVLAAPADELIFRARHAHLVQGDLQKATRLYMEALQDRSLDAARQASVRFRIAVCLVEAEQYERAAAYLEPAAYDKAPAALRKRALSLRTLIGARRPKHIDTKPPPRAPDTARIVAGHLRRARTALLAGDLIHAHWLVQVVLDLDPDHAAAKRLEEEIWTQLGGMADFVKDPLKFLRSWTDAQTKAVARRAEALLKDALRSTEFNLADSLFGQAVAMIDNCEFKQESDELVELRHKIVARWRKFRQKHGQPEPKIEEVRLRSNFRAEFLRHLQRMLDVISAEDREYRIVPLNAPRADARLRWRAKPERYLLRNPPSRWTPALFARRYLPRRVDPESWSKKGNYLETAGGMLVAHNRPPVLDALEKEVRRIEKPDPGIAWHRFLLVTLPAASLRRLEEQFGAFEPAGGGIRYRVVPPRLSLDYICGELRVLDADVRLKRDIFQVGLANGVGQPFFAAVHSSRAPGYEQAQPAAASDYGLLLDT